MYFVYILKSKSSNKKYIGVAGNTLLRLEQHNNRQVRSTKAYVPWELIYTEQYSTKTEALHREHELKHNSWKKKELFDKIDKK